jgi:hypothetical protein
LSVYVESLPDFIDGRGLSLRPPSGAYCPPLVCDTHRDVKSHAREPRRQDQEVIEEATVRASHSMDAYAAEVAIYRKARWGLLVMQMDRTVQAA